MTHLDETAWRRIVRAGPTAEERAHLLERCEICEDAIAGLDEGAVSHAIDHALAALAGDPSSRARLPTRRLEREVMRRVLGSRARRWPWAVGALAAAVLALMVAPLPGARPESNGMKGTARAAATLTAMVSVNKGPLTTLERKAYPSSAELFFTYDLPSDAHVYLGRLGSDGIVEPFFPPVGVVDESVSSGSHSLRVGATIHSYSLEGLRGKQRFILVTSPKPLEGEALEAALHLVSASPAVEVEVEDW